MSDVQESNRFGPAGVIAGPGVQPSADQIARDIWAQWERLASIAAGGFTSGKARTAQEVIEFAKILTNIDSIIGGYCDAVHSGSIKLDVIGTEGEQQ
jgi:hypothetical protein